MPDITVPVTDPDVLLISGLSELLVHLDNLTGDASTPIEAKLFDDVELQLTESNTPNVLPTLLPRLTTLLFTLTNQDPSPLLSLTTKLLAPIPFQDILPLASPEHLLIALQSPLPGANILALSIIHKAAFSKDDVRILVEGTPALVDETVSLWVGTKEVGAAEKAARVLGDLLEMDCELVVPPNASAVVNGNHGLTSAETWQRTRLETAGHGALWRVVFDKPDNLARIVTACSLTLPAAVREAVPAGATLRDQRAITLSQGRLLRMLPRLASLNIQPLLADHSSILRPFLTDNASSASSNLLFGAGLEMVDCSDILMKLTLIDFFETLVSVARVSNHQSPAKDEAIKSLLREAMNRDESGQLRSAMTSLPDRTVEEEAEALREYLRDVLS